MPVNASVTGVVNQLLGPDAFVEPTLYRILLTARSWWRDLVLVLAFVAAAVLFDRVFLGTGSPANAVTRTDALSRFVISTRAQVWYPGVLAAFVLLICLRSWAYLGVTSGPRRLMTTIGLSVFIIALAALRLEALPGSLLARYAPLAAAVFVAVKTPRWRNPRGTTLPTSIGVRPSRAARLMPRSHVALYNLAVGIPAAPIYSTNIRDTAHDHAVEIFVARGDAKSEAYVRARLIESHIAAGHLVDAERLLADAATRPEVDSQPALIGARALFLDTVGRSEDALATLEDIYVKLEPKVPAMLVLRLSEARLAQGDERSVGGDDRNARLQLIWAGYSGPVLLNEAHRIEHRACRDPDSALHLAYKLFSVAHDLGAYPLANIELGQLFAVQAACGVALMTIASICEDRGHFDDATHAYLDAVKDFQLVHDRSRIASGLIRAGGLLLNVGLGSPAQEAHALDLIRAALEITESERAGLRATASRGASVRAQYELLTRCFEHLASDVVWYPERAGELALWLVESLHRTSVATAIRSGLAISDVRLAALLETLAHAEREAAETVDDAQERERLRAVAAQVRADVAAEFSSARDAELSVNPVTVADLQAKIGGAVALLFQTVRGEDGWVVNTVLYSRGQASARQSILPYSGADGSLSPGWFLNAIADGRGGDVALAFAAPLWDEPWPLLGDCLLPEELATALPADGDAGAKTELVIVPDGPLASIPFAGLRLADGRLIAEAASIRLAPSLSFLPPAAEHPVLPIRSQRVVVHIDKTLDSTTLGWGSSAQVTSVASRREFEEALSTDPEPDLAIVFAHGTSGASSFENGIEFEDSRMSAAAALRLRWPKAVILGSCWIGSSDVLAGQEPFGFPIACMLKGAETIVGAVAASPEANIATVLNNVAKVMPSTQELADVVRSAYPVTADDRRSWEQASAMDWPSVAVWSITPLQGEAVNSATAWGTDGLPSEHRRDDAKRLSLPLQLSRGLAQVLRVAQAGAGGAVVSTTDFVIAAANRDSALASLPGADAVAQIRQTAGHASSDKAVTLDTDSGLIALTDMMAEAVRHACMTARRWGLAEIPLAPTLLTALMRDESPDLNAHANVVGTFAEAAHDRLKQCQDVSMLLEPLGVSGAGYDARATSHRRDDHRMPILPMLRNTRRWAWGAVAVALAVLGASLASAVQIGGASVQRGFLGIALSSQTPSPAIIGFVLRGTPAAAAGLEPGDEIVGVDNTRIRSRPQALQVLHGLHAGARVHLEIMRAGSLRVFTVVMAEWGSQSG